MLITTEKIKHLLERMVDRIIATTIAFYTRAEIKITMKFAAISTALFCHSPTLTLLEKSTNCIQHMLGCGGWQLG